MNLEITFRGMPPSESLCSLVRQSLEQLALNETFTFCKVLLVQVEDETTQPMLRAHIEFSGSPHGTRVLVQAHDRSAEAAIHEAFARLTRKPDHVWPRVHAVNQVTDERPYAQVERATRPRVRPLPRERVRTRARQGGWATH